MAELMISWVKHDSRARMKHLPELIKLIRWGVLKAEFLIDKMENEPLLKKNPESQELLVQILHGIILPLARKPDIRPLFQSRPSQLKVAILILPEGRGSQLLPAPVVLAYLPVEDRWVQTGFGDAYRTEILERAVGQTAQIGCVNCCLLWGPDSMAFCTWEYGKVAFYHRVIPQQAPDGKPGKVVHVDDKLLLFRAKKGGPHNQTSGETVFGSKFCPRVCTGKDFETAPWYQYESPGLPTEGQLLAYKNVVYVLGKQRTRLQLQRFNVKRNSWSLMGISPFSTKEARSIILTQCIADEIHYTGKITLIFYSLLL